MIAPDQSRVHPSKSPEIRAIPSSSRLLINQPAVSHDSALVLAITAGRMPGSRPRTAARALNHGVIIIVMYVMKHLL
jgi:hypothetical protein